MPKAVSNKAKGKSNDSPKFYPADDVPQKVPSDREAHSRGVAKLRHSIQPGTVLILLAGRFRGRRVVFLKQLPSGLLLVTGPYQVNGIPLRRVNQAYVIATSTKVDIKGVDAPVDDAFFGQKKAPKKGTKGDAMFAEDEPKPELAQAKKDVQAKVDGALMGAVGKAPLMAKYLKARFSLSKADKPHKMLF